MKDKKDNQTKSLKEAKKHPDWYTKEELMYVKMIRKLIKAEEKEGK